MFILCLSFVQNQEVTEPFTTEDTTTSIPQTTTPVPNPPEPTEGFWNVTDGNRTCIRANLKLRFKIPVYNRTEYVLLPPDAEVTDSSSCNATNNTQILDLSSGNFSLTFVFGQDAGRTFVEDITMAVTLSVGRESFSNTSKQFSVTNGNSYRCKSKTAIPLDSVTMEVFDIHIQAFGGEEKDFATAEDCEMDNVSDVVPIVVACALCGLIIIVFIAYLVGRRRSRQKGYSSV